MADITEAYQALERAHAAGDTQDAQKIADYIRSQNMGRSPQEGVTPVDVDVGGMAARGLSDMFKPQDPQEVSGREFAGGVGGGAVGGAVTGVVAPKVLETVGKVIPGWPGKVLQGAGKALGMLPAKERAIRGAGGGAAAGVAEAGGKALGAPPALTLAAELAAGGLGESAASFLTKETGQLLQFVGNASYGNVAGASRAVRGMLNPNKELNAATAGKLQKELFGEKTEGYINGLIGSDNRLAAQKMLRQGDPSLAQASPLTPASQIYREKMYDGVTQAVQSGKTFSNTPEATLFRSELKTLEQLGKLTPGQAAELRAVVAADKSKNPAVLKRYAENIDDNIRQWGKQLEKGGQTGAAAVDARTATEVREALRKAYNQYTERLGLGDVERRYRGAYAVEKIAEAKDKLPHFLQGFGKPEEFAKLARNLARDPAGKPFIQQTLARHMAQQEPKQIVQEFERLEKGLVNAELVNPVDLKEIRAGVASVKRTADKGVQMRVATQLKQMVMMAMARKAGAAAGRGVVGPGPSPEEQGGD